MILYVNICISFHAKKILIMVETYQVNWENIGFNY